MLDVRVSSVICSLVDKFLDRKSSPTYSDDYSINSREGMVITVNCSTSEYSDDRNYHADRQVMFIFSGNTTVFMAIAPEDKRYFSWREVPLEAWVNTSNHDSCWRSDGCDTRLSEVYFSMCEEINEQLAADGQAEVRPCDMHHFNTLGNGLFEKVLVTTTRDSETHNPSYFRKVVSIGVS